MKSHIVEPDRERALQEAEQALNSWNEYHNKRVENAFRMGAASISKFALELYIPDIENAKNAKQRKEAIEALKVYLGKGDNLVESEDK